MQGYISLKRNENMKALIFIYQIFKKFPALLITNTLLSIVVGMIDAFSLIAMGPLIDFMLNADSKNISPITERVIKLLTAFSLPLTLWSYLLVFAIFIALGSCFHIFVRYSVLKTKYAVLRDIMLGTFDDFFRATWYFFSSSKQGVLLNTFIREINLVGDAFGAMALFFADLMQLIFYLAIPFYISWKVTSISLAAALFFIGPFMILGRIAYRLGRLNTETSNQMSSVIQESFGLAKVILGFGNQEGGSSNLRKAFNAHRHASIRSQTLGIAIPTLYQPFGVAVLIVALFTARKFGLHLSEMTILLLGLYKAASSIGHLAYCKNSLENFFPSYEQIKRLRDQARELKQRSGEKIFTDFVKEIKIDNVSYAYPGHEPVLIDINMAIQKGKMVAIVGESGAGKSTLIDVIMGFNEPTNGRVTFDNINMWEFDINSYRRRIGYVPQDAVLFNMTIRDNLLWAKEDATEKEIEYACKEANADEFIESFLYGYDTLVGDRGVRLSGGQRQRIALATAILRKPVILFLDEATSSLDTHSERLIQQAIEKIAKETTIIVIAHRLSTIVNADCVYVLKKGRIIEEGTYSDLVRMGGHFNSMVKLQLLETFKSDK